MSNKVHLMRKKTKIPLIGQPSDLNEFSVLPSKLDVMRYFEWTRNEMKIEGKQQPEKKAIAIRVVYKLEEIWKKSSIPDSSTKNILYMVLKLREQCEKLKKSSAATRKNPDKFRMCVEKFKIEVLNKLFDICSCKCAKNNCSCPGERKIPKKEQDFLEDQRNERLMMIGGYDVLETRKIEKRNARKL